MKKLLLALTLAASPALAQETISPSEIAVGIANDVGVLARMAEQQKRVIAALKEENEQTKKKLEAALTEKTDTAAKNTSLAKELDSCRANTPPKHD